MSTANELIEDYISRLEAAARALPADRREELLNEITEHISVTLAEKQERGEATIRTILERLGDPDEIVREASGHPARPTVPAGAAGRSKAGRLTGRKAALAVLLATLLALTNVVFPLVAWAVGAVLAWALLRWPARHKLLAVVVWPLGFGLGGWFLGPGASESATCDAGGRCTRDGALPIEAQMGLGLAGVLLATAITILLVHRDRRAA